MDKIKKFIQRYRHAWILSYALIYITWFSYLEKTINHQVSFHVMHAALDDKIPFCEYFIIPYMLWFAYVAVAVLYFMFKNRDDFYRLCAFLFSGMTISLIICSVFPNGTDFRPILDPAKNIFTRIVAWLYRTDTCTNVFPSIHCYNSIGVTIAVLHSQDIAASKHGRLVKFASTILAILICMSTMALKQHSVYDVAGAIILASIVFEFTYGYPLLQRSPQDRHAQREHATERYWR